MKEKTAVIYARQSSGKEEESESIEMQQFHCEALAKSLGLEIVGIFSDANASGRLYPSGAEFLASMDLAFLDWFHQQTGGKMFRSGMGDVLAHLPGVRYLLVDDLTRIARPVAGSYLQNFIQQSLRHNHIQIITVKDGIVDYDDFSDRLISDIQSSITDNQIRIQSQKSRDALRKLRDSGLYPNRPKMFGIIPGTGHKAIEVEPERARVIKYVYSEYVRGKSWGEIQRSVNQKWRALFDGRCCYISLLRNIIRNPFYCGLMRNSAGALIKAQQMAGKAVIDKELWFAAQERFHDYEVKHRQIRSKSTDHKEIEPAKTAVENQDSGNPFTGLLRCGNCGSHLVLGKDKNRHIYFCNTGSRLLKNPECAKAKINVTMTRITSPYCGLLNALRPLLLLAVKDIKDVLRIIHGPLPNIEYARLLKHAILSITSFHDRLEIETVNGPLNLPRYLDKQFRNLPKWSIRQPKNTIGAQKIIEITYTYNKNGRRKLEKEIMNCSNLLIKIFFKK